MRRSGFTLVELLVSVTILVVLAAVTVAALEIANAPSPDEEARSLASYLKGARARAIHGREKWGVRLNLDPYGPTNAAGNPITVTSVSYVRHVEDVVTTVAIADDPATAGVDYRRIIFYSTGPDGKPGVAGVDDDTANGTDDIGELGQGDDEDTSTEFARLQASELFDVRGVQLKMTLNNLTFYAVARFDGSNWILTKDWPSETLANRLDIQMEAKASRLLAAPSQPDRVLSRGVCIDLETSRIAGRIPGDWYNSTTNEYSEYMDIVFNPAGTCENNVEGVMTMQLITAFTADVEATTRGPVFYEMSTRPRRDEERLVTIGMKTGGIGSAEINFADTNGNDIPDDPFLYAETGR